ETFCIAVRGLHVGVTGEGPEVGHRGIVGLVPEHRRLTPQPRELLVRDPRGPLIGTDEIDVHKAWTPCSSRSTVSIYSSPSRYMTSRTGRTSFMRPTICPT